MLPALLAVLALAGAPSATRVECNPDMALGVGLGLTVSDEAQVIEGKIVQGRLDHVFLGQLACGALVYASASAGERNVIRRINPGVDFDRMVGVGLQVALHEAEHVALNSSDECQVEKAARAKVNDLIARLGDPDRIIAEQAAATASDALLPAEYHGC